jgi:hypothetical protein
MNAAAQKVRPKAAAAPEVRRSSHEPVRAAMTGAPRYLKASLRVGGVNDPEEREAEHAATVVASGGRYRVSDPGGETHLRASEKDRPGPVRALAAPPVVDPGAEGRVRRAPVAEVVDPGASGRVRRAPGPPPVTSDAAAARRIEAARAAVANPLPAPVKARLEHGFGHKLDSVRVHKGPAARAAAASIGARAYTEGNRITLGDRESEHDLHLMAHETAHVVQNRAAVARSPAADPAPGATPIRRFGLDTIKNFFADHANNIPGFRMFTIVIGVNPLTMQDVDASPANILRAVVELMPLGAQIVQALDKYAVFDKVGAWVSQQLKTLAITGSAIGQAVSKFLDSLHLTDIASPGDVWDRAKQIFTEPIDRIKGFVVGLVDGVIQFVKDTVIHPLADLASKTRAWDLLIALLGKNPITGDPVPQTAETLIGGFMKLAGQDDVWENIKKSNAIGRAFAWFKGAMAAVLAFAQQIPGLFLTALKSFKITDLLDLPGTIARVVGLFGDFAGRFISWAIDAALKLAEIVFDAVSPGAWGYVQRTGAALKSILKNPLPFVGNLVQAAKLGLQNFAGNIGTHLKTGLIDWLTGSLPGVYIPKAFSLIEVGKFALSVLGVSWAQIRGKIVKALGAGGEKIMAGLETAFDVVVALVKGGPAAAWEVIKDKLGNLKDMVIEGITSFVVDTIVKKAIPKLVAMFIPGAGFISAIISIYGTIMAFMERLSKIVAAVTAFIDSIVAIAAGQIAGAAAKVESALAGVLSLAIGLLAGFLGLGGIAAKVMAVVEKVRGIVDKALDTAIAWIVGKAKSLFGWLFGGGDKKDGAKAGGKVGEDMPFDADGDAHHLWVDVKGGSPVVMLASTPKPLTAYLQEFQSDAKDIEDTTLKGQVVAWIGQAMPLAKSIEGAAAKAVALPIDTPPRTALDTQVKANESALRPILAQILKALGSRVPDKITPPIVVTFTPETGLDMTEYRRQLADQTAGINAMVVADWMVNRMKFAERRSASGSGRHPDAAKAQKDYRTAVRSRLILRLQLPMSATGGVAGVVSGDSSQAAFVATAFGNYSESTQRRGFAESTATKIVDTWMRDTAALHSPDQVAGGEHDGITGLGLADVNTDIGANWGQFRKPAHLANGLQKDVQDAMTRLKVRRAFWRQVKMNVSLNV